MTSPTRRTALVLALVAAGVAVAGVRIFAGIGVWTEQGAHRWPLARFTDHDVEVALAMERDSAGRSWITSRFTPTRDGFHLYAKELPRGGIRGIGRPTLLEVSGPSAVRASGPLQADRAAVKLAVPLLGLDFPVYPAGPVTLRLPVEFAHRTEAELSVTYMACSERTCLAPAIDRRVAVSLPDPIGR
jgi:hypothetical protein